MGRASRDKGKRGEQQVVDWLKKFTGAEWRRTPLSGGMHLDFPFDVSKRPNQPDTIFDKIGIEAKNTVNLQLPEWIKQCEEAEQDFYGFVGGRHVIFYKHRGKWRIDMPLDQFERFMLK